MRFGATVLVTGNAYTDAFLVKYNNNGIAQWAVAGNGNNNDMPTAVTVDALNNIYITGYFSSSSLKFGTDSVINGTNDGYTNDVFIAKFDGTGALGWIRGNTSNSATSYHALSFGIAADAAGNVYTGGRFGSAYLRFANDSVATTGGNDLFLVKYDVNGNFQWLKSYRLL